MRRLLAVLAALVPLLLLAVPAQAQAPVAVGWWGSLPAPPDVGETDLLLQGGDPQRLVPEAVAAGLISTDPEPSAIAAVRFLLGPDAAAGDLTLSVAAGAQATDTRAYATTDPWQPAQNGPRDEAPSPDLGRYVLGQLDAEGTALVFPGAGKLATDAGELSLVLVAGATDRVVVHAPTATALAVEEPAVPAPPFVPAPEPVPTSAPPVLGGPATAPLPGVAPVVAPAPSAPVVVVPPAPVAAVLPVSRPASLVRADDSRTRAFVLLQALLVVVFFGLLGAGPLSRLAVSPPATAERGVGRFRAVREGAAPRV